MSRDSRSRARNSKPSSSETQACQAPSMVFDAAFSHSLAPVKGTQGQDGSPSKGSRYFCHRMLSTLPPTNLG